MIRQLPARIVTLSLTLVVGAFVTFVLGYYGPGDPVRNILGLDFGTRHEYLKLRHEFGLDRPVFVQFADYLWGAVHGDLGQSWQRGLPVSSLVVDSLEITLQLIAAALFVTILIGLPLGVVAALNHNKPIDRAIVVFFIMVHAIPPYALGPMMLVLGVLILHALPITLGWHGLFDTTVVIPALTLALGPLVFIVRQMRNGVLEVYSEQHIVTAEAMGLPNRLILWRHVLPNALSPVINTLGLMVGGLLAASVFIESIFNIPGYGGLLYGAVTTQDFPLLVGSTIVGIAIMSLMFLVTDVLQALVDPRIKWR